MKKLLLALTITVATIITFSSCTKEEYITNYLPAQTVVYERVANDWKGGGNRLTLSLPVNELTEYYIAQGSIQVHMSLDNERTYQGLPAVINGVSYSYEYSRGLVKIYLEDPIMQNGSLVNPPSNAVFKITLFDADYIK